MPSAGCESPCRDLGGLTRTIGGARNRSQHSPITHQSTDPEGATKDPDYGRGAKTAAAPPITHQPFDAEEERGCAEKRSASVRGGGGGGGGGERATRDQKATAGAEKRGPQFLPD